MVFGKCEVTVCGFGSEGGAREAHLVAHIRCRGLSFREQCTELLSAYRQASAGLEGMVPVMERYFLSDASAQQKELESMLGERRCAVSIIEQPPLDGTKIAMLAVLQENAVVRRCDEQLFEVSHGAYRSFFSAGMRTSAGRTSRQQAKELLLDYCEKLGEYGCSLADNCVRTWFFVQNIDVNYAGVVTARNEVFSAQGLTGDTHFIASTGIGGRSADCREMVQMDACAICGLKPGQLRYLYAPSHMNRTCEYGVSFERGAVVGFGDRRHVLVSGTASIDNRGCVVHKGDVRMQTLRMLENVGKLLEEAECTFDDVMHMIVYLRDVADYDVVAAMFAERFPDKPVQIVLAPVCRPDWLIEMECMAITADGDSRYERF